MTIEAISHPYSVIIGSGVLTQFFESWHSNNIFVLADSNSSIVFRPPSNAVVHYIDCHESNKTLCMAETILEKFINNGITRHSSLVTIGGGLIGDIGGFVASIILRGVNWINAPTSLLAQVDSCIGGKTGVNSLCGKNLIGTFYNPSQVIIDIDMLKTLSNHQLQCGIAEVLKHSLISSNGSLFEWMNNNSQRILNRDKYALEYLIKESVLTKFKILQQDPLEKNGRRIILNFGHTIGHAIEYASDYMISHGIAIAIGIAEIYKVAKYLNLVSPTDLASVLNSLRLFDFPTLNISQIDIKKFSDSLTLDKKRINSNIQLIMPIAIGSVKVMTFDVDSILPLIIRSITNAI